MTATVLRLLLDGSQRQTPKLARILTPADLQERGIRHEFTVGPAMFGPELGVGEFQVGGELVEMKPIGGVLDNGCSEYGPQEARDIMGKILLINRGGCLFVLKARTAQKAGAAGVIITDNVKQYNTTQVPPFSMSGDGSSDIIIPAVFMQRLDALLLRELLSNEAAVKWYKRTKQGQTPPTQSAVDYNEQGPTHDVCSSWFIEPVQWMESSLLGKVEGKILCLKCSARVGSFNWSGDQCSCGQWVTPSFQIHKAQIDETRTLTRRKVDKTV